MMAYLHSRPKFACSVPEVCRYFRQNFEEGGNEEGGGGLNPLTLHYSYACLLLKVHGELLVDSRTYTSYCNHYVTEWLGEGNQFISTKSDTGGEGVEKGP